MSQLFRVATSLLGIALCAIASLPGGVQSPASSSSENKENRLPNHASGPFDVKLTPQTLSEKAADPTLGRMTIEKQYHGDLEAAGKGEMLTVSTTEKGSGVYVAIEHVSGTLQGRKGSFSLHHTGVMTRNTPDLRITVVPDSGTDQLAGLTGTMSIKIDSGKHSYQFDYSLPPK
jgi:Protein of unknown function (DUF3224)